MVSAGRFTRHALIPLSIVAVLGSPTIVAQRGNTSAFGRTISEAQKKASQAIADDAAAGRPVSNDFSLAWIHDDLLKVQSNGEAFVPFILTIDPAKVTGNTVSVYWRVVSKVAAVAAPTPAANARKNDKAVAPYAFESITPATIVPGVPGVPGGPVRISRSFTTVAGSYDVYVVVTEGAKAAVIKQTINVPDLWNGELNTSSVILAERINPLPVPLSAQEKVGRPYALGGAELVPYTRLKFLKKEELGAFILIYNAKADAAGKPDVTVEFNFYTKQGGAEKFFNRTLPTNLNGQTLPPQDVGTIQLQAGQAVPLRDFPEGDYRMEIKVTDNIGKKDVKRDVSFSVTGP